VIRALTFDLFLIELDLAAQVRGCRFLMPVWFVDDVEVDAAGKRASQLTGALAALGFRVSHFNGSRMALTPEARQKSYSAQKAAVARERGASAHTEHEREAMGQARPDADDDDDAGEAAPGVLADAELCAVCLDAPCSALIKPCGHTSTCLDCARLLKPPLCVTCRGRIAQIVPWRDL
jgi:hypothetical protein